MEGGGVTVELENQGGNQGGSSLTGSQGRDGKLTVLRVFMTYCSPEIFNKPYIAGAVLQSPLSLIDALIH